MISGLHHVSLIVTDTSRALDFYHGILGLAIAERPELDFPGAWLQIGAHQIHLLELLNPDPVDGRPDHGGRDRHVAVTVTDFPALQKTLDDAAVPYTLSRSGRAALFCRDPDGNAVEIIAA